MASISKDAGNGFNLATCVWCRGAGTRGAGGLVTHTFCHLPPVQAGLLLLPPGDTITELEKVTAPSKEKDSPTAY